MFADGIEQARKQEFAGRIGAREKTGHQIPRSSAFPFLTGKTRRINKGTIGFMAVQKALFEEPVERGHHCGVRERTVQLGDNVADTAFAARPENFHQFEFERAECEGLAQVGATGEAIFEEANHGWRHVITFCWGSKKRESSDDFVLFASIFWNLAVCLHSWLPRTVGAQEPRMTGMAVVAGITGN